MNKVADACIAGITLFVTRLLERVSTILTPSQGAALWQRAKPLYLDNIYMTVHYSYVLLAV